MANSGSAGSPAPRPDAGPASASGRAFPPFGRQRPVVNVVRPRVDGGAWPSKAAVGDRVVVEADVLVNGHDRLACDLRYAHQGDRRWITLPMRDAGNDRWRAELPITGIGLYRFAVRARPDSFETWKQDLRARMDANQDITTELQIGATLLEDAAGRADGADRRMLASTAAALRDELAPLERVGAGSVVTARRPEPSGALDRTRGSRAETVPPTLFSEELSQIVGRHPDLNVSVTSDIHRIYADSERARFSAWYELFPRSASPDPSRAGTLADVEARLRYVAKLGFDVVYLPPIHPIGRTNRKGRDGQRLAQPGDPGSPWAIGATEGGHRSIHPELGTFDDLRSLVATAASMNIEVALDLAFQASPDHPWVREHPEWFRHDPDGTIRHAENPPKQYEDIYPLNFETIYWRELWNELLEVGRFWAEMGIRIFRVDNPHTKPFRFWEWFIASLKADYPEMIFLAEAFTRPKVMYQLAKLGFTQSYTYFAWKNAKWELEEYFTELTQSAVADFFRPNLWPNTPDILTELLQSGETTAFVTRLILAATLSASYGIYGPAFELQVHAAREPGSEEYFHSEKYEVRHWELADPKSLAELVARINEIRHAHSALQHDRTLRFHRVENDQMIVYSKRAIDTSVADAIVVVANLDVTKSQAGWVHLDLRELGVEGATTFVMHDLLTQARYRWDGDRNYVILDPAVLPVHVFSVERDSTATAGVEG
jgi:starch synthase (maltosyl-transferring)